MASPDAELKVRIEAELATGFLTAFKTGAKIPKEFAAQVETELKRAKTAADQLGAGLGKGLTVGSNQAAFALTNLGRVAQDAPFGFIGIQNNLNPLLESFQRLKAESGGTGAALKALGQSLIGHAGLGVALSLVTAGILLYTQYIQSSKKETEKAAEANNDYSKSLSKTEQAQLKGTQNAQQELITLKLLYDATQNTALSVAERTKRVDELQAKYPSYFKNIKDEIILAGGAKDAYDDLSASILLSAQARAGIDVLTEGLKEELVLQKRIDDATTAKKLTQQQLNDQQQVSNTSSKKELDLAAKKASLSQIQLASDILTNKLSTQAVQDIGQISLLQAQLNQKKKESLELSQKIGAQVDSGAVLGDGKDTAKTAKDVKTIADIFKELTVDLTQAQNNISGTFSDKNKEKVTAYQKAIDELIKIGVDPASSSITALKSAAEQFTQTIGSPILVTKLEKSMRFSYNVLPKIAKQAGEKATESIISPLQALDNYIGTEIFPKLQSGFESFFNDILEKGTFSFAALGQAILKTFTSVLASEATRGILGLLNPAQTQLQKDKGGGLFGLIGGLFKKGGGAAATGAGGGLLLPLLGGIAAGGLIASLFKKRKSDPYIAPAPVATSSASNIGSADFNAGRVVFEISGTNLIGVLNRAGQRLQRYNII